MSDADRIKELERENATARELIALLEEDQARGEQSADDLKEAVDALERIIDADRHNFYDGPPPRYVEIARNAYARLKSRERMANET